MGGRGSGRRAVTEFVPDPGAAPYERQPKETDQAWRAFVAYRDSGLERTVDKAIVVLGKQPNYRSTMEKWSTNWGWRMRCASWDATQDDHARETQLDEIAKMRRRHLKFATTLQGIAAVELNRLVAKAKSGKAKVGVDQLLRILEAGVKLERFNRGEPESRDELNVRTPEERDARIAQLMKAYGEEA